MIPIGDEMRSRRVPFVNYALLAINIVVYFMTSLPGDSFFMATIVDFGLIPAQVFGAAGAAALPDFFTSMFLHGSLLHLGGNMLYLWIFGDNVEDALGHVGYVIFYLAGGVLAALAHVLLNLQSTVPTVGASGAIAAVLGAYLILYPGSRVRTIIPLGIFTRVTLLPATVVLGFWFLLQLFDGVLALGAPPGAGGVAFWAHIGGFVAGVVLAKLFARKPERYGGPLF